MTTQIKDKIISTIKKNRISSVEVADALGKTGVIQDLTPLLSGKFVVGEVQYIFGHSESNWSVHEQAEKLDEGGILFIDGFECRDKAIIGDLVAKYLILYKGIEGIVINGKVRDVHTLRKENYPIWCTGYTPLGCHNKKVELSTHLVEVSEKRRDELEGSIFVCDDSGCTMISRGLLTVETLTKLEFIELQEDIWYYCLDTLKWSTFKTICKKDYLKEKDALPEPLRLRLEEFDL
jgi:regulator of RNase E activity RraA